MDDVSLLDRFAIQIGRLVHHCGKCLEVRSGVCKWDSHTNLLKRHNAKIDETTFSVQQRPITKTHFNQSA